MMNVKMTNNLTDRIIFQGEVKDLNELTQLFCKQDTAHTTILITQLPEIRKDLQ